MRKILFVITLSLLSQFSIAGIDPLVLIKGKIGNEIGDKDVKIKDSMGQTYRLKKTAFPKNFKFQEGQPFTVEVHEKELKNLKVLKK